MIHILFNLVGSVAYWFLANILLSHQKQLLDVFLDAW